jgi:hypothetical protein
MMKARCVSWLRVSCGALCEVSCLRESLEKGQRVRLASVGFPGFLIWCLGGLNAGM